MSRYVGAILMALVWVAITGSPNVVNLLLGLAIGSLALFMVRNRIASSIEAIRPWRVLVLFAVFVRELILSGWRVARLLVKRDMGLNPGILEYPLTVDRDFEIALLANMITLTPGTLSVDVSPDRKLLYIHALDCSDVDEVRRDINRTFERRILGAFRR